MRRHIASLFVLLTCGCSSVRYGVGDVQYYPIVVHKDLPPSVVFSAAVATLSGMGPGEFVVSDAELRVTATFPEGVTRDVVTVQVVGGDMLVEFHTEVWDDGAWRSGVGACAPYEGAREWFIARAVERRLAPPQ